MALLLKPSVDPADIWLPLFQDAAPELEVRVWRQVGNPSDIGLALMRRPEPGSLDALANMDRPAGY